MRPPSRFWFLLGAILLVGAMVAWPFMRRLHDIGACLDRGDTWDYSAHQCLPAINPMGRE
jgi:hypothetical protein